MSPLTHHLPPLHQWEDSEPLGWAASLGQLDAVRALIECGADPLRPANKAGNTPLSDAKREQHERGGLTAVYD